ncbi:MAG: ABC transporter permease [Burkholderiales bacterium]|nr:ABC transporter permease [Phycisphaerae bacterium]
MMYFLMENFRLGLKNLYLHRLRTLLTALGIIIGVAAVIIMVAIGEGSKREALRQMQALGARNVLIRSIRPPEGTEGSRSRLLEYGLREADLAKVRGIPGLDRVVPMRDTKKRASLGGKQFPAVNVIATTSELFPVINLRLSEGSFFTALHEQQQAPVCVIGAGAARQIFPSEDPIGRTVLVGSSNLGMVTLQVIGVLEPTGLRAGADKAGIMVRDIDNDIYFPLSLSQQMFGKISVRMTTGSMERESIEYTEIWVQVTDVGDVERTSSIFSNVVGLPGRQDVQVKAPIELLRAAEQQATMFNYIMGGIASFSLVVGGIGIMNIMLATVTERTREIGIRRALGAKQRHITLQFLIETTVISLTGGLIGVGLGTLAAWGLPLLLQFFFQSSGFPTAIAPWSVLGSFLVSGLIGVFFGLYPAIMAARMNPIEALRHE